MVEDPAAESSAAVAREVSLAENNQAGLTVVDARVDGGPERAMTLDMRCFYPREHEALLELAGVARHETSPVTRE